MKTLQQLVEKLNHETQENGIDNALDLLSPFTEYKGEDWQSYFKPNNDEFQYSIVHKDEHLKLIVIYWNSFKVSEKHGHMKGGGLMRVLSGQLIETRFDVDDKEKAVGTFQYVEGDLSYIHDALAYHVVENRTNQAAVSLHLYCSGTRSNFGFF